MTKEKNNKTKQPKDPITREEILDGLKASGYPFEIRLLKAFSDMEMKPHIGFRIRTESGGSREVDIMAAFKRHIGLGDGRMLNLTLRLIIEAKNLEPGAAFVGFPWKRPSDHELRVQRMYFGGTPSNRIIPKLERDGNTVIGSGGLAESFDAMNEAPVCVQWAVVRRTKSGSEQRPIATHDDPYWQGIDGVIRSSRSLMMEHSVYLWPNKSLMITFEIPVLLLATPNLWLFDAAADTNPSSLSECSSFILSRMFEVEGHVEQRIVDVVSEDGVFDFVSACKSTIDDLEKRARNHADALTAIASRQRKELEMIQLESLRDDFRGRNQN